MPVEVVLSDDKKRVQLRIFGDLFFQILNVVRSAPARTYNPQEKTWEMTPRSFLQIRGQLEKVDRVIVDNRVLSYFDTLTSLYSGSHNGNQQTWSQDPLSISELRCDLRPFQCAAVRFLTETKRCLLSDSVGLGKTVSAIAAAMKMRADLGIRHVLVIGPSSIMEEWKRMVAQFTPFELHVINDMKNRVYSPLGFFQYVSYDTIIRDAIKYNQRKGRKMYDKSFFKQIASYDLLICDEVHRCGNSRAKRTKVVTRISHHIPYFFGLSATPLQNHLRELYNIFRIIDANILGPFPVFAERHFIYGNFGQIIGYRDLETVRNLIAPYMLRRTRDEVAEQLPKKTESRVWVDMHPDQRRIYDSVEDQIIKIAFDKDKERRIREAEVIALIQYLRQACLSSYLIDPTTSASSKLDELKELVADIHADGNKMIIYCFYRKMCDIIANELQRYGVVYLHGDNSDQIARLKEEFRGSDKSIFLMTRVGGEGLNLDMANVFIFMNPEFNPQIMTQLAGRIDRLTQTRPIEIIHILCRDTYEERMVNILDEKQSLFDNVINYKDIIRKSIISPRKQIVLPDDFGFGL